MHNIYCTINHRKYHCLIGKEYVTFIDAKDKDSFLTVAINPSTTIGKLVKHSFFYRPCYN